MTKTKTAAPMPDNVVIYDDAPAKLYVIYCPRDSEWWMPNESGYTNSLLHAGTYPEDKAQELAKRRDGDVAIALSTALRERVKGANPVVLQGIAALGGR